MNIISVHCKSKPGMEHELTALCCSMILPSRAEPGCIYYGFYQDMNEKTKFFFYEEWKDQESIDRHNKTQHFLDFQPKFAKIIEGDAIVTVHSVKNK